jgi:hypothetical protein
MVAIAGAGGLCRVSYLLGRRNNGKNGGNPAPRTDNTFVRREVCEERHLHIQSTLAKIEKSVECLPEIKVVVDQLWRDHVGG